MGGQFVGQRLVREERGVKRQYGGGGGLSRHKADKRGAKCRVTAIPKA